MARRKKSEFELLEDEIRTLSAQRQAAYALGMRANGRMFASQLRRPKAEYKALWQRAQLALPFKELA